MKSEKMKKKIASACRASYNAQMCISDVLQSKTMHYNYSYYVTMMYSKRSLQEHIPLKVK